jgi:hypothetical protein
VDLKMKRESAEDLHHPRATRDPRSVPVVFIVTGLTHSANMADNSTEMHEKPLDLRHQEKREASLGGSSTSPIPPTKPSEVSGIWGYFAKLGNLPEWKFGRKESAGKALDYIIGICASCGFLMFSYDRGVMSALLTLNDL